MRTYVYIDGFNLFYGCLKGHKNKWLNVDRLASAYFPLYSIDKIKYFSAAIRARANDLDKPVRQQIYFRALRTNPKIEIILGSFSEHEVRAYVPAKTLQKIQQQANVLLWCQKKLLPLCGHNFLIVKKTEEKGSDVNLGAHLVMDAYEKRFDVAIVVSNDSDLAEPIRIVNSMDGLTVKLLNPYITTQQKLKSVVGNDDIKYIRAGALANCQFSELLTDKVGDFHIPEDWK